MKRDNCLKHPLIKKNDFYSVKVKDVEIKRIKKSDNNKKL